ncbi:MAG: Ig-like domain-containing protein [Agathobacter sp.]|nr:Ig-like domain-containing protein [Agathobacter sp.]
MDRKDITPENSKPTEDIVTTESGLESESELPPEKEEPSESTNTEDIKDDTIKVEIGTNNGGNTIIINGTDDQLDSEPEVVPVTVSSIMLSESFVYIQVGQLQPITATVLYSDNSKDSNVIWVSSNEAIATVDQNGMVVTHSIGEVEIIAQASSGNVAKEARCKIVVGTEPIGYDISLSTNKAFLHETFQIYVTPFEENTKIIVYGRAPSGTVYEFEYSKDKKFFVETEIGIWTIYAKIENEFGVYEAFKPEDFVTIEIVPWNFAN